MYRTTQSNRTVSAEWKRKKEKLAVSLGINMEYNNTRAFFDIFPYCCHQSSQVTMAASSHMTWSAWTLSTMCWGHEMILTSPSEGWHQTSSPPMAEGNFSRAKARRGNKSKAVSGALIWRRGNWTSSSASSSHHLRHGSRDHDLQQKP